MLDTPLTSSHYNNHEHPSLYRNQPKYFIFSYTICLFLPCFRKRNNRISYFLSIFQTGAVSQNINRSKKQSQL